MSDEVQASASELFKGMGLSQENAQKLVDFHAAQLKAAAEGPANAVREMQTQWRKDVVNDPTLGDGKGLKPAVSATIAKGIDALGSDIATAFREAMDETGMGNHPAIVRAIHAFAQRVGEGTHVAGRGPSAAGQSPSGNARPSAAQALYPNLPSAAGR